MIRKRTTEPGNSMSETPARKPKAKKHQTESTEKLLDVIIDALQDKKGKELVSINLNLIQGSICDYFVICHGESTTQVDALSKHVEEKVKLTLGQVPRHIEGFENALWILLDYSDIVIHIFQKDSRDFYHLEDLWADGEIHRYTEV